MMRLYHCIKKEFITLRTNIGTGILNFKNGTSLKISYVKQLAAKFEF
jgi:hypothetical protein